MDTSKLYIDMCRKAEEIQKQWIPTMGDFTATPSGYFNVIKFIESRGNEGADFDDEDIWLPRQDQLQNVGWDHQGLKINKIQYTVYRISWVDELSIEEVFGSSLEQCWLRFIMSYKYSKQWNGKDWK